MLFFKNIIFTLLCAFLWSASSGQSRCDLIKNYSLAACNKDTVKALRNLEAFSRLFPTDSLIEEINLAMAEIYKGMGAVQKSKNIFWKIVAERKQVPLGGSGECPFLYDSTECRSQIYIPSDFKEIQYKACLHLHEISFKEKKYDSALFYLNLADTDFPSSLWCFYSPSSWHNELLCDYSAVYEATGDFDKAIDVLACHIISDQITGRLIYLLKKYKNIDSIRNEFNHLEDSISIEYGIVSESPKVHSEYDKKTGRLLRTTSIEEYGRTARWHFLGYQFYVASANDYISSKVRGEGKKRKLKTGKTNDELIDSAKKFIRELQIYQAVMN